MAMFHIWSKKGALALLGSLGQDMLSFLGFRTSEGETEPLQDQSFVRLSIRPSVTIKILWNE